MADLFTVYCPESGYTTPALTLEDVARHLAEARTVDDPCPADEHTVLRREVVRDVESGCWRVIQTGL